MNKLYELSKTSKKDLYPPNIHLPAEKLRYQYSYQVCHDFRETELGMFHMHTLVLTFTPLVALISLEYVYSAEIGTGTADFLSGSAASVFLLHLDLCVPSLSVLGLPLILCGG